MEPKSEVLEQEEHKRTCLREPEAKTSNSDQSNQVHVKQGNQSEKKSNVQVEESS